MMKKSFGRYLKRLLKDNIRIVIPIVVLAMLILVPIISSWENHLFFKYTENDLGRVHKYYSEFGVPENASDGFEINFGPAVAALICLCFVMPVLSFYTFKSRRNLDTFNSLPLSRRKIAIAHYLSGLITVLIPTAIAFIAEVFIIIGYGAFSLIDLGWLCVYFAVLMVMGWLFYSMNAFVFNEANHIFDGVAFMIGWNFVFFFAYYFENLPELFEDLTMPWVYIMDILARIEGAIETTTYPLDVMFQFETTVAITLFWLVLGLLAVALFLWRCDKKKSENAGSVSDSLFGYRSLIPLFIVPQILNSNVGHSFANFAVIAVWFALAFAGFAVCRRSLKFKESDYWTIGCMAFLTAIIAITNFLQELHY
ncbi:MAG: hypothetical protein IIX67_05680 [Clostridia bacterium]|nr:hypothetical protein [Clostridia bacterium]